MPVVGVGDGPAEPRSLEARAARGARVLATGLVRRLPQGRVLVAAVSDLTLEVVPGEFLAVLGQSGSGKTTLMRLLGAIDRPDEGTILVDDTGVERLSERAAARFRAGTGFLAQQATLLDYLSALDNVILPLSASRVDFSARMHARDLLERVGMGHRAGVLAGRLSGGERQRVAIARAMISRPRLVLADEPTGGLPSADGEEILRLLTEFHRHYGMTLILATSDSGAASAGTRVVRIRDGALAPARRAATAPAAVAAATPAAPAGDGRPYPRLRVVPGPGD